MFIDFNASTSTPELQGDICLVGSGVLGLALCSHLLAHTNLRLILLESGGLGDSADDAAVPAELNSGDIDSGVADSRARGFGGSSQRWAGQALPFSANDLAPRPYLNGAGWPLRIGDLAPYYAMATRFLGLDERPFSADLWNDPALSGLFAPASPLGLNFSKYSPHPNLAPLWRERIAASDRVICLTNAHASHLEVDADRQRVSGVAIRSRQGRPGLVRAQRVVLCAGGVENPRLLLASDQVHPGGLGNDHDLVGRYYQDHVGFYGARLEPLDWPAFRHLFSSFVHGRHKFVPKLQLTDAAQCSLQLLNVTGNLGVQLEETAPVLGLRRLYNDLRHGALGRHNLRDLKMLPQAPLESAKILYTHVVQRRIRIPRQSRIFLIANAESEPLRDSRIQLAAERDAYGLRRPRIHWLVSDRTRVALDAYFAEVKRVLEGAGIARVHRNPMLAETNDDWKSRGYSLYHHMGGTRMASRPEDGVVNPDGRVFAMPNLYVAGSSVFPTGSSSNPTFTALALSFRLAEHLAATTPAP